MNQILSVELNNNNKQPSKSIDIKKIVIFFAIAIVVIGIIFVIVNGVKVYSNKEAKDKAIEQQTEPQVEFSEISNDEAKFIINHDKPIVKLSYSWNDGEEIDINTNNRTYISYTVPVKDGTNILKIKITDDIGSVATVEKIYTKEVADIKIDYSMIGNIFKVKATDKEEMQSISYEWNSNGNETVVKMTEDVQDKKSLEVEIEVPKGQNTLKVIATNKKGNTKVFEKPILGVEPPKIQIQKDGEYLVINVKDENVLTLVDYDLNNIKYRINLTTYDAQYYNNIEGLSVKTDAQGQIIEMEYRQLMTDKGVNIIKLTATNKQNGDATFEGKCTN